MAIFTGEKKNTKAAEPAAPAVTPMVTSNIPASIKKQTVGSESRVAMQSIGVAYANGKANDSISPNTTAMREYANAVLAFNTITPLTRYYAPNEMPSMLYDLQSKLGLL